MTGLSNRKRIEEQIAQALEDDKENGAAFLFIDVDNFKAVNDTLGHMFGDEVLRHVASEIRRTVRTSDIVGRVGGDEFIVFLRNIRSLDAISKKAGEICAAFKSKYSEAIPHGGISCSVGIALYPGDGACYEDLMHKADQALYAAKEKGKNCFAFYDVHSATGRSRPCSPKSKAGHSQRYSRISSRVGLSPSAAGFPMGLCTV
ncbi:MAG: diguanylate cyclase domain-containing protein [Bilophila wadsworthia]